MIRKRTGVPFAFGGQVTDDGLRLSEFDGAITRGLRRLLVEPGAGLGGRVINEARPAMVHDYGNAPSITHEYDRLVLAEGINSVVAAPVIVGGKVTGILYASVRGSLTLGARATNLLVDIARHLSEELLVREEVDRRVKLVLTAEQNRPGPVLDVDVREEIRALQGELRRIAHEVDSPGLRDQLRAASRRLATLERPSGDPGHRPGRPSARESSTCSPRSLWAAATPK